VGGAAAEKKKKKDIKKENTGALLVKNELGKRLRGDLKGREQIGIWCPRERSARKKRMRW